MKNKLIELINVWAQYEEGHPEAELREFCSWYLAQESAAQKPALAPDREIPDLPLNGRLGRLIGKLSKYAFFYSKKAFQQLSLNNFEDMGYLWQIQNMGTPKKSEVIYSMLSEFPSGMDIIKRLVNLGLAEEFPDEQDKRSKRLAITAKGRELLFQCRPLAEQVGEIALGRLSQAEKAAMIAALERLADFHDEHYKAMRNVEFGEIYARLTG